MLLSSTASIDNEPRATTTLVLVEPVRLVVVSVVVVADSAAELPTSTHDGRHSTAHRHSGVARILCQGGTGLAS